MTAPSNPRLSLFALSGLALAALPGAAQTPLTTTLVASGLDQPLCATAPPGDDRLFICEQNTAEIKILKNGSILPTPFIDLDPFSAGGGERGLLGLAFHPDYANNGRFFTHYTNNAGNTVIARFEVSSDPDVADPSTGTLVMLVQQPFSNHNGGTIAFGPDGYLYIGLGDGGSGNDPDCHAQNLNSLLGKLLRIDVDGPGAYSIPPDNPFVGMAGVREEIWSYGLRNPWRWSFDRETGDIYIGDVGQFAREEITFEPAGLGGLNHGWKVMEGTKCNLMGNCTSPPPCGSPLYTNPIHETFHGGANSPCAIVGGFVYRGCAIPDLQGTYFFSDWCDDRIFSFEFDGTTVTGLQERTAELAPGGGLSIKNIASFGQDAHGELYLLDKTQGEVFKIVPAAPVAGADCDANGQIDSCEISADPALDLDGNSVLDACEALSLTGDVASVSISAGGSQSLQLDAGAANAGATYLLLGSLSGTQPGFPIDSVVLPLNVDPYTDLTLTQPDPPLTGSLGVLDAGGQAGATFTIPGGVLSASTVGLVFHHAYLLLSGTVYFASNPILVSLDA